MRVIHILNHSRRLNGNVHAAIDLACAQKRLGHDVAFVSGEGDFDPLIAANGLERFVIDLERLTGTAPQVRRVIAIYETGGGLIRRVWFGQG